MDHHLEKEAAFQALRQALGFIGKRSRKIKGDAKFWVSRTKRGFPQGPTKSNVNDLYRASRSEEGWSKMRSPITYVQSGKNEYLSNIPTMPGSKKRTMIDSLKESVGGTAYKTKQLGQDMKGKGIFGSVIQAGKNINKVLKDQFKQDFYREIPLNSKTRVFEKGNKKFLEDTTIFGNKRVRQMVGDTDRNTAIVKQRKRAYPLAVATGGSGTAIAAGSYAFSDKEKSQASRVGEALAEGAVWGMSGPAGLAYTTLKGIKESKKQKQKATTIN